MKKWFSDALGDLTLLSVASLVLGALLLFFPAVSGRVICTLCALALVIYGGLHLVLYFLRKTPDDMFRHDFAKGLIALLLGVFLLLNPNVLLGILPVVLGLVLLVDSAIRLQKAFDLIRLGAVNWWIVLLLALATGIVGIIILVNPFRVASALLMFIGIGLLLNGFSDLWTIRSVRRKWNDKFGDEDHPL